MSVTGTDQWTGIAAIYKELFSKYIIVFGNITTVTSGLPHLVFKTVLRLSRAYNYPPFTETFRC